MSSGHVAGHQGCTGRDRIYRNDPSIDLLQERGLRRENAYLAHLKAHGHDRPSLRPFQFSGEFEALTGLAHELGHAMNRYFTNSPRPYSLSTFQELVAEVSATFNESLLMDYMLKTPTRRDALLWLLSKSLETAIGIVFESARIAEFELCMHEMLEEGKSIVGEALAALYLKITRKYYGNDKWTCLVDDYVAHGWSHKRQLYLNFYVLQYATAFAASQALAAKVKSGGAGATKRYLAFPSAGGTKHSIDLLKDAGIDITSNEPIETAINEMNRVHG